MDVAPVAEVVPAAVLVEVPGVVIWEAHAPRWEGTIVPQCITVPRCITIMAEVGDPDLLTAAVAAVAPCALLLWASLQSLPC